ncbi:MAG TPA: potassium/proton antiporter, partial [Polyangia bacterium]
EPTQTALLLVAIGALMALSVLFSRAATRTGVPVALLFLGVGMLAGMYGLGAGLRTGYTLAFRLGSVALVLILFDGGLNTPLAAVRRWIAPAGVLATAGVAGTAALTGVGAHALGFGWIEALLLGSIVASTDAAAVFAVLRGSGLVLKRRVGAILELESGLNDPVAVILTVALTRALATGRPVGAGLVAGLVFQLAVGAGGGLAVGFGGLALMRRARLAAGGLYPVLTLALAFLAFAVPTLAHGSGFLAVYIAGVILGNGALPYRAGVLRVHDSIAWFSQIAMFVVLGLLVSPVHLVAVAGAGLALALLLAFVARPVVVAACLAPFRYPLREVAYVAWVGLRGAVPIVLATFPVLAGVPGADRIFDVVFFVVVVNAHVPGATVRRVTRLLQLEAREPPPPHAVLEITSTRPLRDVLMSFSIAAASAVSGVALADLPFPPGSAVMLVVRGDDLIAPHGGFVFAPGDHAYVFCRPEDRAFVGLMFGRQEED